jgi:hypothetical protein
VAIFGVGRGGVEGPTTRYGAARALASRLTNAAASRRNRRQGLFLPVEIDLAFGWHSRGLPTGQIGAVSRILTLAGRSLWEACEMLAWIVGAC